MGCWLDASLILITGGSMKIHQINGRHELLRSIIDRKNQAVVVATNAPEDDEVFKTIQFLIRNAPLDILVIVDRPIRTWAGRYGDVYLIDCDDSETIKAAKGVSFHERYEIYEVKQY